MAIYFENNTAQFKEHVSVEEAETLLEWVQNHPQGEIDLEYCSHIHASALQVLLCTQARVSKWPQEEGLRMWLSSGLMFNRRDV